MARVLPGPYRNSSKIVCQDKLPDGDRRKYMTPKVAVMDIGLLISRVCPKLDITQGVGAHNVGQMVNHVHSSGLQPSLPIQTPVTQPSPQVITQKNLESTDIPSDNNALPASDQDVTSPVKEIAAPSSTVEYSHSAKNGYDSSITSKTHKLSKHERLLKYGFRGFSEEDIMKSCRSINHSIVENFAAKLKAFESSIDESSKEDDLKRHGFLGFPEEDSKRLKKTRFHVNTNILASSLDLLDLHKNAGLRSGSPLECTTCGIRFSSVRHCKYHQSVCSSDISKDPSKCHNVKGDGVWLCPWCPVVCPAAEYLNKHKVLCRERGRCIQDCKASSQRKPLSNSSKRRNSLPSSGSLKSNIVLSRSNSFKVVHGHVIPT